MTDQLTWNEVYWLFGIYFAVRTVSSLISVTWDTLLFHFTDSTAKWE